MMRTTNPAVEVDTTSLQADKRDVTVDRILRAAQKEFQRRGLAVTVEEVAVAAGLSRRTIFRHFATRDELLVAALRRGVATYVAHVPVLTVPADGHASDWRAWLADVVRTAHQMNASYGPGYWELATSSELTPHLAAFRNSALRARRGGVKHISRSLWTAAGGTTPPPPTLVAAVGTHLSAFFTRAVTQDVGGSWQEAAALANAAIVLAVEAALPASTAT